MRILFLNRSYFPDAEATGQLLTELCEDLADDFDVAVIAGQPNQNPQNADFLRRGPERHNGVVIRRVWNARFPKTVFVGRVANLVSYLVMATMAAVLSKQPDVIVVETDPPLLCLLGVLLKLRFRCKSVVYLQDIYPHLGIALGKLRDNVMTRFCERAFCAAYHRADRIIVLSEDMRDVLVDAGIKPHNIDIIPNWIDTTRVRPVKAANPFRQQHGLDEKFVVMYSGNLGLCQALEQVLLAAEQLKDRDDIVFVLVGDGASKTRLVDMAERRSLNNVRFIGYQPKSRLAESLSAADLHLVPVDGRVSRYLMPSKLYGALASGTPVLTVAPEESTLAQLVNLHRVGLNAEPDQPEMLAERILWFVEWCDDLAGYGDRARRLAVEMFDRRVSVARFHNMLERLVRPDLEPLTEPASQLEDDQPSLKGQPT